MRDWIFFMLREIGVVPFFTNFLWCLAYGHSWNDFSQPNLWVDRSRSFFTDFLKYVSYRQFWSNFVLFVFLQKRAQVAHLQDSQKIQSLDICR